MGVNDVREMLVVAKAEVVRLEAELEQVRRLHEVATERTVELAAAIDKALQPANIDYGHIDIALERVRSVLTPADTAAVLRERDAAKWDEGYNSGRVDGYYQTREEKNPYREGENHG